MASSMSHFIRKFKTPFHYLNISKSVCTFGGSWRPSSGPWGPNSSGQVQQQVSLVAEQVTRAPLTYFFRQGLVLDLGLAVLAGLVGQRALRIH